MTKPGISRSYWNHINVVVVTLITGLRITLQHIFAIRKKRSSISIQSPHYFDLQQGVFTIQYPHESIPVPEVGRYKLHNEIDDCIVCDKCVKVCPVNCITIEPIKSPQEFGRTSDDTPKRIYAARFDIDMGKCCFCGLCTTVCPTECLTMTPEYDFSVFDIQEHHFKFSEMTAEEIADKQKAWDDFQVQKASAAPAAPPTTSTPLNKPVFKPKIKPPSSDKSE